MKKDLVIEFKEQDFFFKKECSGKKQNIVVKKKITDKRFHILYAVMRDLNKNPMKLLVCNEKTNERFLVDVSDVSYIGGYYIISWVHKG